MTPNYLTEVVAAKAKYPAAWAVAHHHGHPGAWDFIKLLAADLHAIDPRVGCNGKRGTDELSMDALNVLDPVDGPGRTPDGRRCWVVDVIAGAGGPNPQPAWTAFTNPQDSSGKWIAPGVEPEPEPPPVAFPPRDETLNFALALNARYQSKGAAQNGTLGGRFPQARHLDIEGEAVWLESYLRRRVQGFSHLQATEATLDDVDNAWPD